MKGNRFLVLAVLTAMCITMLVSSASAGHINVRGAGGSANLAGTGGIGGILQYGANAEAGYDLWGEVYTLGDEFDTTMVYADTGGSEFTSVEADLKELSVSGEVSGPEGSSGYAFAAASGQALGWESASAEIETWLFAHTVTKADGGAKAKASATASGTTEGTAWDDSDSEISAKSSGTVSATSSVKSTDCSSSEAASVAAIGASAFLEEMNVVRAGYESFPAGYSDHTDLDDFSDGYLYPGNGLMAVSEVYGTGSAKATAEGSAESGGSAEEWGDFSFEAGASGAVSSSVTGTEAEYAFGLSAIHAWAFDEKAMDDPVAGGDTGTSILTFGEAISEDSKASATMSASGKSSASMSTDATSLLDEESLILADGPLMANIESASSGAITSKVSSTDVGEARAGSIIAGRAVAYPEDNIEWGILLPASPKLDGFYVFSAGAGEGGLYTLVGSASEANATDGKASADVTMSGKASANGDGLDGEYPEQYGKIAGSASSSGEIKSATKASDYGKAESTSQIAAIGGEGPFGIYEELSYGFYPLPDLIFIPEVGGMSYLTTSAFVNSGDGNTASVKSSASGSAAFEGESTMIRGIDEYHAAETEAEGTVTVDASAKEYSRAASSGTIFSKAYTETWDSPLPFDNAIIDYSLIMSDAAAWSEGGKSSSAKGTAEGSTSASGSLKYEGPIDGSKATSEAESTTSADGAMKAEAKAAGLASLPSTPGAYSVAELKSLNMVGPEDELGTSTPSMDVMEDSNLVSFAGVVGGPEKGDKSSAKVQMTGKTASEGSADFTVVNLTSNDKTIDEHVEAETAVSNADKVAVSGSGNGIDPYFAVNAMNYAVSSADAGIDGGKYAYTAGMFGTWAGGAGAKGKVKAEATIDTVKVHGYADPDGVEAEIGVNGGAASAKVNPPNPSKAPPPSYSGALKGDIAVASSMASSPDYAEGHVYMATMGDTLGIPIDPMIPRNEITNPLIFWQGIL